MIEKWIVDRLSALESLNEQCYPVAAPVGSAEPPFAIYSPQSSTITADLSGEEAYRTDIIKVTLFDEDYDRLITNAEAAAEALTVVQEDAGDVFIFSSSTQRTEADAFDLTMEMECRTLTVTVRYWAG